MLTRDRQLNRLKQLIDFSPIVAILGPRQSGKTTLAKQIVADHHFDLENPRDCARLEGSKVDLFWQHNGKNYAAEYKYGDAPRRTKSMLAAQEALELEHLWGIYPGPTTYALHDQITVLSILERSHILIHDKANSERRSRT